MKSEQHCIWSRDKKEKVNTRESQEKTVKKWQQFYNSMGAPYQSR